MERLTSNRFFLDYNATAPMAAGVQALLASEAYHLGGNPSAAYTSGRRARRVVRETSEFLGKTFGLPNHTVLFHSGATEGANFCFQAQARSHWLRGEQALFVFAATDHACVYQQRELLAQMGQQVLILPVDRHGQFSYEQVRAAMASAYVKKYLNFTWANNETGVESDLELAAQIKQATDCYVHVDGVQAIGKIASWQRPLPSLDAYTFSGHKIGALTGIGWTFLRQTQDISPLMFGGPQQQQLRPGTENVLGIYSLQVALADLLATLDFGKLQQQHQAFEQQLLSQVSADNIVAKQFPRAANTTCLLNPGKKAQDLVNQFCLAGIEIGSGSACATGSSLPSRVLTAMGYAPELAASAIRFSFGPRALPVEEVQALTSKILAILANRTLHWTK